jgi:SpoVK/Ycf46/Vps4 family AAA+-type ATPase
MWLNMFLNNVSDINFSDGAFDKLILPATEKDLILGFTESQNIHKDQFDDIIEGKGRGIIMLLSGKPGVGKTLTAEAIAEQMKVPLYMMSAGELGLDPSRVEEKMKDILELCSKWHSILLIDEGDVFLEERSLHELERNKLVSIFLRVSEPFFATAMLISTAAGILRGHPHPDDQPRRDHRQGLPVAHPHQPRVPRPQHREPAQDLAELPGGGDARGAPDGRAGRRAVATRAQRAADQERAQDGAAAGPPQDGRGLVLVDRARADGAGCHAAPAPQHPGDGADPGGDLHVVDFQLAMQIG